MPLHNTVLGATCLCCVQELQSRGLSRAEALDYLELGPALEFCVSVVGRHDWPSAFQLDVALHDGSADVASWLQGECRSVRCAVLVLSCAMGCSGAAAVPPASSALAQACLLLS